MPMHEYLGDACVIVILILAVTTAFISETNNKNILLLIKIMEKSLIVMSPITLIMYVIYIIKMHSIGLHSTYPYLVLFNIFQLIQWYIFETKYHIRECEKLCSMVNSKFDPVAIKIRMVMLIWDFFCPTTIGTIIFSIGYVLSN